MKKIYFLIIGLTYSFSSLGQKVALSNAVSIYLPPRTITLNKDQFSACGKSIFSYSKVALNSIASTVRLTNDNTHFYKVDNVLVALVHGNGSVKGTHLSEMKKGFDAMHRRSGDTARYASVMKTINNNHVLVMYDDFENTGYYNFHCWNTTYTRVLTGSLQFNLVDKDKATKILEDILNEVEFDK